MISAILFIVIAATYKIFAPAELKDDILDGLFGFIGPTEVRPGCLGCSLVQDLGNPDVIIYSEEWQSPHDFENHIRSPRYHVLLNIIDLSIQQPEVKITTTMQEWGMEYIEAIRLAK